MKIRLSAHQEKNLEKEGGIVMGGAVKVEITDSTVHLSNERWKVSVPYRELSSGVVFIEDRIIGLPPDPESPGQWGSKGGGGGGGGGQKGGSGQNKRVPHAPPMPAQRGFGLPALSPRLDAAFDIRVRKLNGLDIVGGGRGDLQHLRVRRAKGEIECQIQAAERLRKKAETLQDRKLAGEFRRRAEVAEYQASRIETKLAERAGSRRKLLDQPSVSPDGRKKKGESQKKSRSRKRGSGEE